MEAKASDTQVEPIGASWMKNMNSTVLASLYPLFKSRPHRPSVCRISSATVYHASSDVQARAHRVTSACVMAVGSNLDSLLNQQRCTGHFFRLFDTHGCENSRRNVTQHTVCLLQTPSFRCIGHDEGNFVRSVRCLWLAFLVEHFLGISVGDVSRSYSERRRTFLPMVSSHK